MNNATEFFSHATRISRFWLPPLLDEIAKMPPAICDGDGCSIYLILRDSEHDSDQLHMAASTRGDRRARLFTLGAAYTIDPDDLQYAAKAHYKDRRNTPSNVGLTGWVAAYGRTFRVSDLNDEDQIWRHGCKDENIPAPVWSRRSHSPLDHQPPTPILIAPLIYESVCIGAIRVTKFRKNAQEFSAQHQKDLEDFAESLAALLSTSDILDPGFEEYFRFWAADDADQFAQRLTEAVPKLLGVDQCSFFLRDTKGRFVLRNSSAREFVKTRKNNFYYTADDGSKTSMCIKTQGPVILWRESENRWTADKTTPIPLTDDQLKMASGGALIDDNARDRSQSVGPAQDCELPSAATRSLLVVPVRDVINPWTREPAGILRVASRQVAEGGASVTRQQQRETIRELHQFAVGLAGVVGRTWNEQMQREARIQLTEELERIRRGIATGTRREVELLCTAAKVICNCLNASAVTIFSRDGGGKLTTRRENSYLQNRLFQDHSRHKHFRQFQRFANTLEYEIGDGRTAWAAQYGKVLNLRNLKSDAELERKGVRTAREISYCEIDDAGPFLAAPISMDGGEHVVGVIRAVRRSETVHGAFSIHDEQLIENCGVMLATILQSARTRAVISYPSRHQKTMKIIEDKLKDARIDCRILEDRSEANYGAIFRDSMTSSDVGLVLAIGEDDRCISDEICLELGQIQGHFKDRYLVLIQDNAEFPQKIGLPDNNKIEYRSEGNGIRAVLDEIVTRIATLIDAPDYG